MQGATNILCGRITIDGSESWERVDHVFHGSEPVELAQGWRAVPEVRFRAGVVRTGWDGSRLFVYAVLEDDDIFNPVTTFNEPAFLLGDVFEIFLRPSGQEAYYEFHVNPNNQQMRLRIPSAEAFQENRSEPGIPPAWFVEDPILKSRVWVEPERSRWRVMATVEVDQIGMPRDEWLFSFSRYDYTRGESAPVLSSSSPHAELSFHRQQEWGRLRFVE